MLAGFTQISTCSCFIILTCHLLSMGNLQKCVVTSGYWLPSNGLLWRDSCYSHASRVILKAGWGALFLNINHLFGAGGMVGCCVCLGLDGWFPGARTLLLLSLEPITGKVRIHHYISRTTRRVLEFFFLHLSNFWRVLFWLSAAAMAPILLNCVGNEYIK